jgi:ATP-binding cassette, subfamily B, bacterial
MAYLYMLKQLWRYAGPERWKIVIYYLLHTISTIGDLGKPYAFAIVVNALQRGGPALMDNLRRGLMIYVGSFLVFNIFHRSARYIELPVAFRCRRRFVDAMYGRLISLPLSWHTEHHSGNLIDRINVAAHALQEFGFVQMTYIPVIIKLWGPLIILWGLSPQISLATLVVGVIMVAVINKSYTFTVPLARQMNESMHNFAAAFFDYMSNMKTIIVLRLGRFVKQDLDARFGQAFPFMTKEHNYTQAKCVAIDLLRLLLEVGVIAYYIMAQRHIGAVIAVGSITMIFQYVQQALESFSFYGGDYDRVIHWQTDFHAARPVLDAPVPAALSQSADIVEWQRISVAPFCFSYNQEKAHLRDVSITLHRPGRIALVGASGSGKSTLLQILRGITELPDGCITIDGQQNAPLGVLANMTTLIPQEPEIFENTIRHNITMGIPACNQEIQQALQISQFDQVVANLPNGLESDIREKGVNLSGGEKQRLALARGVLAIKDSSIVLLDEPTSNIDPRTEQQIFRRLLQTFAERCIVVALHRLHLVRQFDYVYVLKEGRVVEEGTFAELCGQCGEFARLWAIYQAEIEPASTENGSY